MDGLTNLTSGSNLQSQVQQAQQVSQQLSQRESSGKGKSKKMLFLLVILAIGLLGAFLIFKGATSEGEEEPTPSPTSNNFIRTPEPGGETGSEGETEPAEEVDKADISIQVLNGTGISGEASFLQAKLNSAGYKDIKAANASSTNNESAIVAFASAVPKSVVDEITKLLEDNYNDVTTSTSVSTTNDVVITTGLRSGQTLKPASSPAASASPTASPSN